MASFTVRPCISAADFAMSWRGATDFTASDAFVHLILFELVFVGDGIEAKRALDPRRHALDLLLRQPPIHPHDAHARLPRGRNRMLDQLLAGCVAGAPFPAEGLTEEEVLHVDDDEGGFGGGDCYGGC